VGHQTKALKEHCDGKAHKRLLQQRYESKRQQQELEAMFVTIPHYKQHVMAKTKANRAIVLRALMQDGIPPSVVRTGGVGGRRDDVPHAAHSFGLAARWSSSWSRTMASSTPAT